MDLVEYLLASSISNAVACIPLFLVYLYLKVFKISPKASSLLLLLHLISSVFLWFKLKDVAVIANQGTSYLAAFLWLGTEHISKKISENPEKNKDEQMGNGDTPNRDESDSRQPKH